MLTSTTDPIQMSKSDPYRGLLKISCNINSIHGYKELLTSLLEITKEVMNCEAGSLMLYHEASDDLTWHVALGDKVEKLREMGRLKMGQGIAGWVAQNQKSTLVADTSKDDRFFRGADTKTGFQTRSIVCVPLVVKDKLVGVLQALNPSHKKYFEENDLEIFEAYGALAATAIEKIRWEENALQQQKLQQELEIAQEIQTRFLSHEFPMAEAEFQLASYYQPAFQVGGDFYDVQATDSGAFAIILGDVTGKGVPAALLMAQILSEFRYRAPRESDPGKILSYLNNNLSIRSARGMFATAWCGLVRKTPNSIKILQASAGHLHPIKTSKEKAELIEIEAGLPLGLVAGTEYPSHLTELNQGESICTYTDGITEGRNPEGEEYGAPRLQKLLSSQSNLSDLLKIKTNILSDMKDFGRDAIQRDDITFLLCAPR
jgi:sigma-B regulation protein RsbU (phosphoserine phosphatase)